MAILFFDDFRGYSMANMSQAIEQFSGGTWTFTASGGANDGPYISPTGTGTLQKTVPLGSSFVIGMRFYYGSPVGTLNNIMLLRDPLGVTQCSLVLNVDGTLEVVRGTSTVVTGGRAVSALSMATWYYVEWKVTIANSIGAATSVVRVNEVDVITVTTGQDLQAATGSTAGQVLVGLTGSSIGGRFADLYITDGTTFLGDCTVDTLYVNGNGTTQDFDPSSGSDHSLLVDETSGNGDTDYVSTTVATERELFTMGNLSVTPNTIHAVSVWNSVRKDDAGVKKFESTIRSGGTNYDGAEATALDSYRYDMPIWETDPATASAWSESGVNAIEAGIQVTV